MSSLADSISVAATPAAAAAAADNNSNNRRLSSATAKRKWDDYAPAASDDDDLAADLLSVRMRKDELYAVHHSTSSSDDASAASTSSAAARVSHWLPQSTRYASSSRLQFFVRMISEGKTMVFQANSSDSVKSVHERIQAITGIPVSEQRLIYRGKQLQWEQTLAECAIQKDAGLHLVGRMRSTGHPQAWQIIDDMISLICRLCKGEAIPCASKTIRTRILEYLSMTPKDDGESAPGHLQIFMSSSAPAALVMLYMSPIRGNKECAEDSIRHYLDSCVTELPKSLQSLCAPVVLEFCTLLRRVSVEDPLYLSCRGSLGSLLEPIGVSWVSKNSESVKRVITIKEIFPFVSELADKLSKDLESSMESTTNVGAWGDVHDFKMFLVPLRTAISEHGGFRHPILLSSEKKHYSDPSYSEQIELLYQIFRDLLTKISNCLMRMEEQLSARATGEGDVVYPAWARYLAILKELNAISKLYDGSEEVFWTNLKLRKRSLCTLILRYAKRNDDHLWLLEHKDVTDFESRRHLVMMMFPEVKEDFDEQHEMLIDRSQLLEESFEYIAQAEAESLHGGLFMEFKNEEATGPGVLREWFVLVCQALFNQQNALFVACATDRRRFYPNPASRVEPLHLKYFNFSGRMIGLALMHKVQVGIVLDRSFFLQLGGVPISLEDIRDADPFLYSSCKQILEMDAEFIDSDALGLTFVREVEELGLRRVVELCHNGKGMVVNSKNREKYVHLLIKHRFVTSISEQLSHFARGFGDILSNSRRQNFFFRSLELEDLDHMLHGSENDISVEDWKAHTEYNGYKATDPQIMWFWKTVSEMTPEQRKNLLFFWTSVKYLPVEGFRGLASRLHIYKSPEPPSRLPSSHTCFYRICFPPYPSLGVMQQRLHIISQEHVGSSFGTW